MKTRSMLTILIFCAAIILATTLAYEYQNTRGQTITEPASQLPNSSPKTPAPDQTLPAISGNTNLEEEVDKLTPPELTKDFEDL